MAQAQKQTSTPSTTRASFRPSDMVQLGLPSNFNGRIARAVACPWDYNGNIPEHILALRVEYEPDEDSGFEPFSQHYSLGNLKYWAPSQDGINPVDLDGDDITEMEGPYVVWVGPDNVPENARHLGKGTNSEHYFTALLECGFKEEDITDDLSWLEGIYGYWVRVGQRKREGLKPKEGKEGKDNQILVCAELKEAPNAAKSRNTGGSKKSTPATVKKSAGSGKANGADADASLETQVADAIVAALESRGGSAKFTEIRGLVVNKFKGQNMSKAMGFFKSDEFHEANNERWVSQGVAGKITLLGAEVEEDEETEE